MNDATPSSLGGVTTIRGTLKPFLGLIFRNSSVLRSKSIWPNFRENPSSFILSPWAKSSMLFSLLTGDFLLTFPERLRLQKARVTKRRREDFDFFFSTGAASFTFSSWTFSFRESAVGTRGESPPPCRERTKKALENMIY